MMCTEKTSLFICQWKKNFWWQIWWTSF